MQPFTEGGELHVFMNGDEIVPSMLDSIEAGRSSILFPTFVHRTAGIAEEWEGGNNPKERRETHLQLKGPSLHGLAGVF